MSGIDTTDSIEIAAPPERVFETIINYPAMHTWFGGYRCDLLDGETVEVGSRLQHTIGKPPLVVNRFVRTIQAIDPGARIEETYDEGDLVGKGTWTFTPKGDGTVASFHCAVRGNTLPMRMAFKLTGPIAHNVVYAQILKALKKRCEA